MNVLSCCSNDRDGRNFVLRNLRAVGIVAALICCAAFLNVAPSQVLATRNSGATSMSGSVEPRRPTLLEALMTSEEDCTFRDDDALVVPAAVAILQPLPEHHTIDDDNSSPHDETLCVLVGSRESDGVRPIMTLNSLLNARPLVRIFLFAHAFLHPSDARHAGSTENATVWLQLQQQYLERTLLEGSAPPDRTSVVPTADVHHHLFANGDPSLTVEQRMFKLQLAVTQKALSHVLAQRKGCGFVTLTTAGSFFTEKFSLRYWDASAIEVYGHLRLCREVGDGVVSSHPTYRRLPCDPHLYMLPSSGVIVPLRLLNDKSVRLVATAEESRKFPSPTCVRHSLAQWLVNASRTRSPPPLHRAMPQRRITMFEDAHPGEEGAKRDDDSPASKSTSATSVCVVVEGRKGNGDEKAKVSLFNGIMSQLISASGANESLGKMRLSLFAINSEHLGDPEKRNESENWIAEQLHRVRLHLRSHFSGTESEEKFPVTLLRFSELLENNSRNVSSPIQLDASVPLDGLLYRMIDAVLFSSHITAAECSHVLITNAGDYYFSNAWTDIGNALRPSAVSLMKKVVVWSHSVGIEDKEKIVSLTSATSLGSVLKHSTDFGAALIALSLYRERYKISYFGQGPPIDWANTVWGLFDRIDRDVPESEKGLVKRVTYVQQQCTL